MRINRAIPGQLREDEQVAIALVASLVPRAGKIVEVGSLLGRSSWIWAKNADPSVTVFCIDPWSGGGNFKKLANEAAQTFSLEQFRANVADCQNIVALQGYSPGDFLDWKDPIDLYFEDAVHTDPILTENLQFWGGKLAPAGILCGHDYTDRFPDVKRGAERAARQLGRELRIVNSFWFTLPPELEAAKDPRTRSVLEQLHQLQTYHRTLPGMNAGENFVQYCKRVVSGVTSFDYALHFHGVPAAVAQGDPIVLRGTLENTSGVNWPAMAHGDAFLKLGAELRVGPDRQKVAADRYWFDVPVLVSGATPSFEIVLPTRKAVVGSAEVYVDMVYDHVLWFEQKGANSRRFGVEIEARKTCDR
jgi:Methyltransferase domain